VYLINESDFLIKNITHQSTKKTDQLKE